MLNMPDKRRTEGKSTWGVSWFGFKLLFVRNATSSYHVVDFKFAMFQLTRQIKFETQ